MRRAQAAGDGSRHRLRLEINSPCTVYVISKAAAAAPTELATGKELPKVRRAMAHARAHAHTTRARARARAIACCSQTNGPSRGERWPAKVARSTWAEWGVRTDGGAVW